MGRGFSMKELLLSDWSMDMTALIAGCYGEPIPLGQCHPWAHGPGVKKKAAEETSGACQ